MDSLHRDHDESADCEMLLVGRLLLAFRDVATKTDLTLDGLKKALIALPRLDP